MWAVMASCAAPARRLISSTNCAAVRAWFSAFAASALGQVSAFG
jgi:hypothetical protein